jgi:hypothetical protein
MFYGLMQIIIVGDFPFRKGGGFLSFSYLILMIRQYTMVKMNI